MTVLRRAAPAATNTRPFGCCRVQEMFDSAVHLSGAYMQKVKKVVNSPLNGKHTGGRELLLQNTTLD